MNLRARALLAFAMIPFISCVARAQSPAPADGDSVPAAKPSAGPAQSGPSASQPAQPPAASPAWSVGPIDFSGELSGYYTYNANHPYSPDDAGISFSDTGNNLYNFNTQADAVDLSFAKLAISHSPDPVGFELDFGYGRTVDAIQAAEPTSKVLQYIEQVYVDWKPAKAKGFEVDFGKFSTGSGAETIEEYNNWNYSHSLLFSWAIPYDLFGIRTSVPLGKRFTAGFQVVNGWNNVTDDVNKARTLGLTGTLTFTKLAWNVNYHTGPMNQGTHTGFRNMLDTTLLLNPQGKLSAYVNYNYGNNANSLCPTCSAPATQVSASWQGLAGAVHFQPSSRWSFTTRAEWFDDADGYELARALPAPVSDLKGAVAQEVKETTVTAECKLFEGLLFRVEWRRDWSTYPMFERGMANINSDECNYESSCAEGTPLPFNNPSGLEGFSKSQNTVSIGAIAFFGPKR